MDRKKLIPSNSNIAISHPRIRSICNELQRKINVDDAPNAVGVLFRVFLELSADEFIAKNKIILVPPKDKLVNKLTEIAQFMQTNNLMTKDLLKPVRVVANNPHHFGSTNTLNSWVHSAANSPTSNDLKRSWDNLEPFFIQLWK